MKIVFIITKYLIMNEKCKNGANLLRSLNKQPSSRLFLYKIASCLHDCAAVSSCHVTVKQLKMWSPGNSSSKQDQLGSEGKGAEQSLNV